VPISDASNLTPSLPAVEEQEPVNWLLLFEILPLIVIAGLGLTIYVIHKVRQS
jgi:hypothetical protein